jgi:pilus assembly protein Flp/PilA
LRRDPDEPERNPDAWISSDSHVWIMELTQMKNLLVRFAKDDSGATAIEYGLIAAGISVAIIAVVNGLGTKLNTTFSGISTQLK